MRLWLFAAVLLALLALFVLPRRVPALRRLKPGPLGWFVLWLLALWALLDFGFVVPVPASVVKIYMGIATMALLAYVTSDRERLQRAKRPLVAFLTEGRFLPFLVVVALALPALVMARIYVQITAPASEPAYGRTIHPEPPDKIEVHGETVSLITATNPYRALEKTNPDAFAEHVAAGRHVYYQNCFFCHGDLMRGDGIYAEYAQPDPDQLHQHRHHRAAPGVVPVLARLEGRPGHAAGGRAVGLGHAGLGAVPLPRADVGRDPLPLRLHRPPAPGARRLGGWRRGWSAEGGAS